MYWEEQAAESHKASLCLRYLVNNSPMHGENSIITLLSEIYYEWRDFMLMGAPVTSTYLLESFIIYDILALKIPASVYKSCCCCSIPLIPRGVKVGVELNNHRRKEAILSENVPHLLSPRIEAIGEPVRDRYNFNNAKTPKITGRVFVYQVLIESAMAIIPDVLALVAPSPDYDVMKRFTMPTQHGPRAAIAVTTEASKVLQSLYTLLLKMIVIQIWYLIVLAGIAISANPKKTRSHNISIANVIIWNAQASPLDIVKLMLKYIAHISLFAVLWAFLAALAWAASIVLSLVVSPDLIIGQAAPVSLSAIYVPQFSSSTGTSSYSLRVNELATPSNLRAIGQADNLTANANVVVGKPISTTDPSSGVQIIQVDYSYGLTGVEFGLQNATELQLNVSGSCITDYGWFYGDDDSTDILIDVYLKFGLGPFVNVSTADGGPPLCTAYLGPAPAPSNSNTTYGLVASTMTRKSFTAGTDPWYLTAPLNESDQYGAGYAVLRQRPVLSCWQSDIWRYGNQQRSIGELDQLNALPLSLVTVFQRFLSVPRIVNLVQALGTTALKSATGSQGFYFDAQTSNLHDDLQRLVLGAYAATRNTLQETTQFSKQYDDITNLVLGADGNPLPGTDNFVIYTTDVSALSIPMLITVPLIAFLLLGLVFLLTTSFPCYAWSWGYVEALKAAVLYSALDSEDGRNDNWDRTTATPFYKGGKGEGGKIKEAPAHVRPKFDRTRRTLSWHKPHVDVVDVESHDHEGDEPAAMESIEQVVETPKGDKQQ
ncbi:hypothetical protein G7Y89_g10680 [Cudoniella acicularis]|uniref:Uncharacterized protein n=1 Tax=Cudoniella acicularis TaxID=354080 RepID=A0A8H4W1D3_9HELO|nr:hypothetical protein G7Y89_g10680 [Cudoniella acicularis]